MKPLIGVTPSPQQQQRFGEGYAIPAGYLRAVEIAGGIPIVLPPHRAGVAESVAALDGVLFSGGGDIRPDRYGDRELHPTTYGVNDLRDEFELALLEATLSRDLPVLAICRGIQLLNVGLGGTLYQDLNDLYPGAIPHRQTLTAESRHDPCHTVAAVPGSPLAQIYGADLIATNSLHHQALKDLGQGLEVVGRTEDGSIEAVVHPAHRFVLGVQWHPEIMFSRHPEHLRPFERLVREAAASKDQELDQELLTAARGGG